MGKTYKDNPGKFRNQRKTKSKGKRRCANPDFRQMDKEDFLCWEVDKDTGKRYRVFYN